MHFSLSNLLFRLTLTLIFTSFALQSLSIGYVHIENFTRSTYKAGPQNWAFSRDKTGRIYIGNQKGMLIFDGRLWQLYNLKNYTAVRSLLYDENSERIYAGGSEEFGYFYHDSKHGILKYVSVSDKIDSKVHFFTEIWKIYKFHGNIWYQSDHHLFCVNGNTIASFPPGGRISTSAMIDGYIYVALEDGKILRFNGSHFEPLSNSQIFTGKKITGFIPMAAKQNFLVATATDGLFSYKYGEFSSFVLPFSQYLIDNRIFSTSASGNIVVFGTVDGGAVIYNLASGETTYVNKQLGLYNNTILSSFIDGAGDVWFGLDNGLAFACYNTRVTDLIPPGDNIGAGYASIRINDDIFLGTNQGLYNLTLGHNNQLLLSNPLKQLIKGQVWSLENINGTLFVSNDTGLFYKSPYGSYIHISGLPGTLCVQEIPGHPSYAIASTYEKFHLLHLVNNVWSDLGTIDGYDDIGSKFVIDSDLNIWMAHYRKGIFRLPLSADLKSFKNTKLYTVSDGLPDNQDNNVAMFNNRPIFLTNYGIYKPTSDFRRVVPDNDLIKTFGNEATRAFFSFPNIATLWVGNNRMNYAKTTSGGNLAIDSAGLKLPTQGFMPGYNSISPLSHGKFIVSNQDGFWCLDTEKQLNAAPLIRPFVNTVYANGDSIVFEAPFNGCDIMTAKLPYKQNSLRFILAYPDFAAGDDILFSTLLEDYDKEWSQYSELSSREYTHLYEGNYTLRLRALDKRTGIVQEAVFHFSILPPWYRSTIAWICYSILLLGAIYLIIYFARQYMLKARQRALRQKEIELQELRASAEQESLTKNLEIATLKSEQLEQDIRHKSQQLSDTTMSLIHKNEILQKISNKIESIQSSPNASQIHPTIMRQLSSLQKSVKDDIGKDDDWKSFNRNFDIVYGDFTKKLMEIHPNLTISDQRLCCYIRMGLSSKEISPLINISYKSVEMARYRLRKKMSLKPESSLQEYLTKL